MAAAKTPRLLSEQEREAVAEEFESVRFHGLLIAEAARRFANETEGLEWALWATEPGADRGNFNQQYADEQLALRSGTWREARDNLRELLEQHAEAVR